MKIALITDTHFGGRSDSPAFNSFIKKFYDDVFFPYIKQNDITQIIHLGDVFDRRKYINFSTLRSCKEYFFDRIEALQIKTTIIAGNHDTFYKNSNDLNSPNVLLREYEYLEAYSEAVEKNYGGTDILLMPWICSGNYENSLKMLQNTKASIVFGHFEISGFDMFKGQKNEHGMDPQTFTKFDMVCSGHFHHKSTGGNITYLGNPYEMTWADFNDPRGFHIFDTDTRELTFIENPNKIFKKIYYDDATQKPKIDATQYKDCYVKVVVVNKKDFYHFDKMLDSLYDNDPLEVKIVEDFSDLEASQVDDDNIDIADTMSLLSTYVDGVETENVDKERLKTLLKTLYVEAQTFEEAV